jgi:pimeloyl-ACP methyl ester carboxylesterase
MSLLSIALKTTVGIARRLPLIIGATTTGWLTYSALRHRDAASLPDPFLSDLRLVSSGAAGTIAVHESKPGDDQDSKTPVLLIHGVNAAASSMEMRPLFQHFGPQRHVLAMDLPGYGHSEMNRRQYTTESMSDAVSAVLESIGRPTHVIALSLGAEFAARAATGRPDLVHSLTLISPTGLGSRSRKEPANTPMFHQLLDTGLFGQGLYDLLVTRSSIDYFLSRSFVGDVDPRMRDYAILASQQPDARFAPIAFLKGELFTPGAKSRLYEPLTTPTLVLYDEDPYTDFALLPEFLSQNMYIRRAERIEGTLGLPHFDRTEETVAAITRFWTEVESR